MYPGILLGLLSDGIPDWLPNLDFLPTVGSICPGQGGRNSVSGLFSSASNPRTKGKIRDDLGGKLSGVNLTRENLVTWLLGREVENKRKIFLNSKVKDNGFDRNLVYRMWNSRPFFTHGTVRKLVILVLVQISSLIVCCKGDDGQKLFCLEMFDDKRDERHLPYNFLGDFPICKEHERRTCCRKSHAEGISRLFSAMVARSTLSARCSNFYQKSLCSYCDADVGVGKKISQKSPILCHSFCKLWYDSCFDDYFDNIQNSYIRNSDEISFIRLNIIPCTDSSVICSLLSAITTDPVEFCSLNGFSVFPDFEVSSRLLSLADYNSECFNGISAASVLKSGIRERPKYKYKKAKKSRETTTYFQLLRNYINELSENRNAPLSVILFISIITAWTLHRIFSLIF
ncbi:Folate receptor family protein [Cryptosporidium felis]|nr:Folate receptor family protein [Cryptosporidium felis]